LRILGCRSEERGAADRGTVLGITEHGEIYNPLFRFMARYVFGHEATLTAYLDGIQRKVALMEKQHGV